MQEVATVAESGSRIHQRLAHRCLVGIRCDGANLRQSIGRRRFRTPLVFHFHHVGTVAGEGVDHRGKDRHRVATGRIPEKRIPHPFMNRLVLRQTVSRKCSR